MPTSQPIWNRQQPSPMRSARYRPFHERVALAPPVRTWPERRIERAPLWCPVDLRDGNQALVEPMDGERKQRVFDAMVRAGFKQIEVGFASASQIDFDFVRRLIERDAIPDDVTIAVLTPAREELIERTFAALEGIDRAIVHLYTATAPLWREHVFGLDRDGLRALIARGAEHVARCAGGMPRAELTLQFSPETFNLTEPDFALAVCDAVTGVWQPSRAQPAIVNLPSTIESATPNVFADQIEWMDRRLARREAIVLSVHPHNDRGTGVAAAELALLAGAERVEGCLFGNGERTGNVCLVTLALNLHSQGVDPQLDLSDVDALRATVEHGNRLPVHQRHPYGGELVYTSFSGTHQDAIAKVMAARERRARADGVPLGELPWEVPYLPIDPHDVGRSYEAVIRVNSQSGKGGVAYVLKSEHGLELPRRLQAELSRVVQAHAEADGELAPERIWAIFRGAYLLDGEDAPARCVVHAHRATSLPGERARLEVELTLDGRRRALTATGTGPIDAFVAALGEQGVRVQVLDYAEHALGAGEDARAAAYVECAIGDAVLWGVGIDRNIVRASLRAVASALNRGGSQEPGL